jgi:hypothetical protein
MKFVAMKRPRTFKYERNHDAKFLTIKNRVQSQTGFWQVPTPLILFGTSPPCSGIQKAGFA